MLNTLDISTDEIMILPAKQLRKIMRQPAKCAEAVHLEYVSDQAPGITRILHGKEFRYFYNGKPVKSKSELVRIRQLVIPPAWKNVWICKLSNGHLQVTGYDTRNRKQYKYHPSWNNFRNQTKFSRLWDFGNVLPQIRLKMEKHLSLAGMPREKVLAAVVSLMERTTIRVGNSFYEKLYGSYGLTTLKDKHVDIAGIGMVFSFKGKKGVYHNIPIRSKRLASIVKKCRDIPGQELFQYYDDNGNRHSIDSGMVNEYIKTISGSDYSSKDFRTWAGTVKALMTFKEIGSPQSVKEARKNIVTAMDTVSKHLGNTKTICRKYYVHPLVISLYEKMALQKHLEEIEEIEEDDNITGLTSVEKILMQILESNLKDTFS